MCSLCSAAQDESNAAAADQRRANSVFLDVIGQIGAEIDNVGEAQAVEDALGDLEPTERRGLYALVKYMTAALIEDARQSVLLEVQLKQAPAPTPTARQPKPLVEAEPSPELMLAFEEGLLKYLNEIPASAGAYESADIDQQMSELGAAEQGVNTSLGGPRDSDVWDIKNTVIGNMPAGGPRDSDEWDNIVIGQPVHRDSTLFSALPTLNEPIVMGQPAPFRSATSITLPHNDIPESLRDNPLFQLADYNLGGPVPTVPISTSQIVDSQMKIFDLRNRYEATLEEQCEFKDLDEH